MRHWNARRWWAAAAGSAAAAVLLGVPTALIPNPLFGREIAPEWWSHPVWIASAVLSGLLLATYVTPRGSGATPATPERGTRASLGGGLLSWFAIGCPVCNKLVLLAVGTSGAVTWFAPLQPLFAAAGLVLLAWALHTRLRDDASCPAPARKA
ncbi:hypothetical protein HNR23_003393 [Nocardiopsis mwathae]|uniref:Uncharacterized protein n=1 Tax=Nocardiopsis mwathae TaxID=1472723 RepID=A0A7W9YJJ2_9ACTN|nr:hypothetical protein [Nocardiopsis mwathae]MBB6173333.1 hypothetical protein [Nocardiopsis mwathae]